jgi:hypothetical protein
VRLTVLRHNGGDWLACIDCGEADPDVLVLDHVYDDGRAERRRLKLSSTRLFLLLVKRGFPARYQTLCHNCNAKKEMQRRRTAAPPTLDDQLGAGPRMICSTTIATREAGPRCPRCGFREGSRCLRGWTLTGFRS